MIRSGPLESGEIAAVRELVAAATADDGVEPLSEHARLGLGAHDWTHLRTTGSDGEITGYAQLDNDGSGELVVHPAYRRADLGGRLLAGLLDAGAARVWAHGDHPGATALAKAFGLDRSRTLLKLARPLRAEGAEPIPAPVLPDEVTVRTFRPGEDDAAWLELNAAAFATHPEQGRWAERDLQDRMGEAWFDPDGFFLAERDGTLIGFHWTKAIGDTGEIYVLGVHPKAHGTGLGTALALVGLRHLDGLGLDRVELYVEESNVPAVRLYTRLGFARAAIDVQYTAPPS